MSAKNFKKKKKSLRGDLEPLIADYRNLIPIGDLNVHVNDISDNGAVFLLEAMSSLRFTQHVQFATDNLGNTGHIVLSDEGVSHVISKCVPSDFLSDHRVVICQFKHKFYSVERMKIQTKKLNKDWKSIFSERTWKIV